MAVTSIKIALVICGLATLVATDDEMLMRIRKTIFNKFDLNQDGVMSPEEVDAEFDCVDANKDGALTLVEISGIPNVDDIPEINREDFIVYDGFDGKVDGLIHRSAIPEYIRTLDTNGDGVLGFEEKFAPLKKGLEDTCEVSQDVTSCKGIH